MSILLDCLAIVGPGYEAPRAQATYEERQPRLRPVWDLCACGVDEKRLGRTQCESCIYKSEAGKLERFRHNAAVRAAKTEKRSRDREEANKARLALAAVIGKAAGGTCACGRPARPGATCGRRICR